MIDTPQDPGFPRSAMGRTLGYPVRPRRSAEAAGQPAEDACGPLTAGLIVSTWSVAFAQGQEVFDRTRDLGAARGAFLALVDRGAVGTAAALSDTPCARRDRSTVQSRSEVRP